MAKANRRKNSAKARSARASKAAKASHGKKSRRGQIEYGDDAIGGD